MTPRKFVLSIFLIIGLTAPVQAEFEDGMAALDRADYERAHAEFLPLAKQGNRDAQFALGQMYDLGIGLPRNVTTAFNWYREAAELGHPGAQSILGFMHAYGVGTQQNIVEGYVWSCFPVQLLQAAIFLDGQHDQTFAVILGDDDGTL